ncbi:hypothetical protein [Streptomyces clavuligerus]|uniref:Secreted protein n=1 Tax=Streptomyces clavuligerus TaxID=1901 RepID=B5GSS2_STRCL|nr:hypothetical protein [Streptomyces clavuligerus]ANW18421.1 hypothetical protein BB341_09340 [Streptomyces clavuligerus]AXU12976.1 hypothetical protein D1794_09670 [Streptomyces clavuligerus]EDY49368.1 hypothetical protein SSCG_02396 [Streptomyces clavuligerus]EFG08951.1 Hypothetical protein SCLAV_3879 [Streptomyces clavuligerus]MBY6302904.1 hypothetical protein [Streptomyces clavuligerus]
MKYTRVAAIVAGSVAALGAASPALAAPPPTSPSMSLNGGVDQIFRQTPLLNGGSGDVVRDVADTASALGPIKGTAPQNALKTLGAVTPLLGGVQVGG